MTAQPHDSRLDHLHDDAQKNVVEPGHTTPQAHDSSPRLDQAAIEVVPAGSTSAPQAIRVAQTSQGTPAGSTTSPPAMSASVPVPAMTVVDPLLFIHATAHGDLEQIRIASENRLRQLTNTWVDDDGIEHGFGLPESHPDVARLGGITSALAAIEHGAELNLKRALRTCGIHPWVKGQIGLGDKQVARLLGVIGDPYWHLAEDRPRTVSELWAYCGLHVLPASHIRGDAQRDLAGGAQTSDLGHRCPGELGDVHSVGAGVAARRRKGQRANWSTEGKTRAYLIATSCIKQARSPYRVTYDERRAHTAVTHPDWTAGHSHNDALRITSKAILRDLWREAKRLHAMRDWIGAMEAEAAELERQITH